MIDYSDSLVCGLVQIHGMDVLMMSNSSQCNKMLLNWSYQLQTIIHTIIAVISRDNHTGDMKGFFRLAPLC